MDLSNSFNPQPKPDKTVKVAKPLKRSKVKAKKAYDSELWDMFSIYIRLRDSDENGIVRCCTCGKCARWRGDGMQAGHGIPRQHWGARYNEKNVQTQCGGCNKFQQGAQIKFAAFINKKYGPDTWVLLQAGKDGKKYSESQMRLLYKHYRFEAQKLAKQKGETI